MHVNSDMSHMHGDGSMLRYSGSCVCTMYVEEGELVVCGIVLL